MHSYSKNSKQSGLNKPLLAPEQTTNENSHPATSSDIELTIKEKKATDVLTLKPIGTLVYSFLDDKSFASYLRSNKQINQFHKSELKNQYDEYQENIQLIQRNKAATKLRTLIPEFTGIRSDGCDGTTSSEVYNEYLTKSHSSYLSDLNNIDEDINADRNNRSAAELKQFSEDAKYVNNCIKYENDSYNCGICFTSTMSLVSGLVALIGGLAYDDERRFMMPLCFGIIAVFFASHTRVGFRRRAHGDHLISINNEIVNNTQVFFKQVKPAELEEKAISSPAIDFSMIYQLLSDKTNVVEDKAAKKVILRVNLLMDAEKQTDICKQLNRLFKSKNSKEIAIPSYKTGNITIKNVNLELLTGNVDRMVRAQSNMRLS